MVSTTDFFHRLSTTRQILVQSQLLTRSDVFAMGASVVMAINVAAFPEEFPQGNSCNLRCRCRGGSEAGGTVAGGHTIRNPEPIYGLAVRGGAP